MIKSKKLSKKKNLEHGFFNRRGGESIGIFKSLNCGPGSSDSKKNVLKNIKIVSKKIINWSVVYLNSLTNQWFLLYLFSYCQKIQNLWIEID